MSNTRALCDSEISAIIILTELKLKLNTALLPKANAFEKGSQLECP